VFIALLPALLTVILLRVTVNAAPADFIPAFGEGTLTDQIVYWSEINTFRAVGFEGGYFNFSEVPARANFTPYGAHSFVYPALIGIPARLFGWGWASPVYANMILIGAALAGFILLVRPDLPQLFALAAGVAVFYPLLLFIPTAMQETINQAAGILAAGLFYVRLSKGSAAPRWISPVYFVLIAVMSLVRLTWAFMFLPYLWLIVPQKRRWLALVLGGGLIAAAVLFFLYTAAPYQRNFLNFLMRQMAQNPSITHLITILYSFFLENTARLTSGEVLAILQRIQVIGLILAALLALTRRSKLRLIRRLPRPSWGTGESAVLVYTLGFILLIHLQVYAISDLLDFRVMSAYVLFALLWLIAFRRLRTVAILIGLNLIALPAFLSLYTFINTASFSYDEARITAFEEAIAPHIAYDPQVESAWGNTVLTGAFPPEMAALPDGVGFVIALPSDPFDHAPRSRWLLLTDADLAILQDKLPDDVNLDLQPLVETSAGTLYLNLDAQE
jgi:hypothetical protein